MAGRESLAASVGWYRDLMNGAGAATHLPRDLRTVLELETLDLAAESALAERAAVAAAREAAERETLVAQAERRRVVMRAGFRAFGSFLFGVLAGVWYGAIPVLIVNLIVHVLVSANNSHFVDFSTGYVVSLAAVAVALGAWSAAHTYRERTR